MVFGLSHTALPQLAVKNSSGLQLAVQRAGNGTGRRAGGCIAMRHRFAHKQFAGAAGVERTAGGRTAGARPAPVAHRPVGMSDLGAGWLVVALALLLALVLVPHVGKVVYGARRWISLGPLSFQPSELAKVALVVGMAMLLSEQRDGPPTGRDVLLVLALAWRAARPDVSTSVIATAPSS